MERKIGEIFQNNGEWYQCVEGDSCGECSLFTTECRSGTKSDLADKIFGECSKIRRLDSKHVIFKKLEKVGEPYEHYEKFYQCYKLPMETEIRLLPNNCYPIGKDNLVEIEIKQKEDMEEKEPTYEELLHYYHSTVGLWAIDRNPQEVNFDWICKNAFQLGLDKTLPNFEKIGKNLKPFNLEASRSGKPVCTRDGRKARIICFDREDKDFPMVALITEENGDESVSVRTSKGCYWRNEKTDYRDLMMLPEKKEGYIIYTKEMIHPTKESAERFAQSITSKLGICKVEWEE